MSDKNQVGADVMICCEGDAESTGGHMFLVSHLHYKVPVWVHAWTADEEHLARGYTRIPVNGGVTRDTVVQEERAAVVRYLRQVAANLLAAAKAFANPPVELHDEAHSVDELANRIERGDHRRVGESKQ